MDKEERETGGPSFGVPGPVSRMGEYPRRFRQFLHEVRGELSRVTWPTGKDVKATTGVVIVTVFFFGVFLFAVDRLTSWGVERVLDLFRP